MVSALSGWRRSTAAFAAGAVSVLAMAPFFLFPVLFLTLPVLVWLIDGARTRYLRSAAAAGWCFGFGYFLFGLFWIGEAFLVEADKFAWLLPFAVTLMPAGLALFYAGAATAARAVWPAGFARVLVLAIALSCAEWLRGHVLTGFPWNVLGYALTYPLALMQSASIFGIYGLTLIAVAIFAGPLVILADASLQRRPAAMGMGIALAVFPLLALFGYGAWRLFDPVATDVAGARVRIVQASIDQRDKWRPELQGRIFREHLDLSRVNAAGRRDDLHGVTHLVWPEAAMPFLPLQHPEALAAIGELLPQGTQLISGALRLAQPEDVPSRGSSRAGFNSLMVFDDQGKLASLYDKIHLVPFGEYLPMQAPLEAMGLEQLTRWRGGFSAGPTPRPLLSVQGLPPAAGLICYEAIFPAAIVQGAERPGLLINVTNDGWFGDTTGPWQHFHQARVRAVEEGLPLLRAANNGISAVIDSQGRVNAILRINARGVIDSNVPNALAPTHYARFGDWTFVGLLLVFSGITIAVARNTGSFRESVCCSRRSLSS